MRLSTQIKPISYVKANAAQIIDELADGGEPIVVTQNGEAKAVVMSVHEYEQREEALALLKVLAMGSRNIAEGRTKPAEEVFDRLERKYREG